MKGNHLRTGKSPKKPVTGSPSPGEPVFLIVGSLQRTHGIHGEILMKELNQVPDTFQPGKTLLIGDEHTPVRLRSVRMANQLILLSFEGFDSPEDVGRFRNQIVSIKVRELPRLPDGEYYHHQLVGLDVQDQDGRKLGVLHEIIETGANDVYIVKTPLDEEILLPAIPQVILKIDLSAGIMQVRPPEWR